MSWSVPVAAAVFRATVTGLFGPDMKASALARRPMEARSIDVSVMSNDKFEPFPGGDVIEGPARDFAAQVCSSLSHGVVRQQVFMRWKLLPASDALRGHFGVFTDTQSDGADATLSFGAECGDISPK